MYLLSFNIHQTKSNMHHTKKVLCGICRSKGPVWWSVYKIILSKQIGQYVRCSQGDIIVLTVGILILSKQIYNWSNSFLTECTHIDKVGKTFFFYIFLPCKYIHFSLIFLGVDHCENLLQIISFYNNNNRSQLIHICDLFWYFLYFRMPA